MAQASRGVGLVRRAMLLVVLTGFAGAGALLLLWRSEVTAWLQHAGWPMSFGARLGMATLLAIFVGELLASWLFAGADRAGGAAVDALAMADGEEEPAASAERGGMTRLAAGVEEWRHRVRSAEAARQRLEEAALDLASSLEAMDVVGGEPGANGGLLKAGTFEDGALRRLATAAEGQIEATARLRVTIDALLARVTEDLAEVDGPFKSLEETLAGMASVLDDLIATQIAARGPDQPALAALAAALGDCTAEVARAGQVAGFVDREITAVRRRLGVARVERLTERDLVDPGA